MRAKDVMTRDPVVVTPDEQVAKAAEIMRERDVGIIPVVDDRTERHLRGVITDRDIVVRCVAAGHGPDCRIADHMTDAHLDTVRADASVDAVIEKMGRDRVRRIPVVDARDHLVGIIAQADLALRLGPSEPRQIEELLAHVSEPTSRHPH